MSGIAAVVPVKALLETKTRLSGVLEPEARAEVALWMLERVVGAVRDSRAVEHIAVVSPDARALKHAVGLGTVALRQEHGKLNQGLALGREWACAMGAEALLILLGDLPRLIGADVRDVVELAARATDCPGKVVISPDRHDAGTNVLLLRPPDCLSFLFGRNSFARHGALARERGLDLSVYRSPGTAFDLDWPADLEELRAVDAALPRALADAGAPAERRGHARGGI